MAFHALFGDTLLTKEGVVPAADVLKGKQVVGVYFAAKGCSSHTATVFGIYQRVRRERGDDALEIVYVSADKGEDEFQEQIKDMIWPVAPFKGDAATALAGKYLEGEPPNLQLFDADGNSLLAQGLKTLRKCPYAWAYPWSEEAIKQARASREVDAKDFRPLFGGGALKQKGGQDVSGPEGFGGRRVVVVRCVAAAQPSDFLDTVMVPVSKELEDDVAFVYLCPDEDGSGMAGRVATLPDGWFYAEPGSPSAAAALKFYSEGRDAGVTCCEADGTLVSEDAIYWASAYGAAGYPWTPAAIEAAEPARQRRLAQEAARLRDRLRGFELLGDRLTSHAGDVSTADALLDKDYVLLYFSAHWCPPCRAFTPKLAERYNELKASGAKVELVFLSSDRDENGFKEYFENMPWLALPYSLRDVKESLKTALDVASIPTLVICNKDGTKFNKDGENLVMNEPSSWKLDGLS